MLEFNDLCTLAKKAIKADNSTPVNFSYDGKQESFSVEQVNNLLRNEIREMIGYEDGKPNYYK